MNNKTPEQQAAEAFPSPIITDIGYKNMRIGYATCIEKKVEPLEREVVKLRALVQRLMDRSSDVISRWDSPKWKWDQHTGELIAALRIEVDAAKQAGFVPTNTTEGNG